MQSVQVSFTITSPATELHFDFGTATSPVTTGYTKVTELTAYTTAQGYGWTSTGISSRDRGSGTGVTDLTRDICYGRDITFAADVPNGSYSVTVTMGDRSFAHDLMAVIIEGQQVDLVTTAAGQFYVATYPATVTDGQLTLELKDTGGTDTSAVICGLDVVSSGPIPLSVPDQQAPNGSEGTPYSYQIIATGGKPPYTFVGLSVPPGLSISQSGVLGGVPTVSGLFDVTFTVSDMNVLLSTVSGFLAGLTISPKDPSNVVAAQDGATTATINWTNNATIAVSNRVRQLASDGSTVLATYSVPANVSSFQDTGLTPGATYYWDVSASDSNSNSEAILSNSVTMTGGGSIPGTPTNLVATAVSANEIDLTWTLADSNDSGVSVEMSANDNQHFSEVALTAAHASGYNKVTLAPSTTYYFRVRAHSDLGDSGYSNEANATTQAGSGDQFGLTVDASHPRIWYNNTANRNQLATWWATHSFTPGTDYYDLGLAYYATELSGIPNSTYLANAKAALDAWFLRWAYQGTVNTPGMVQVGSYSSGLAYGITASDNYRWGEGIVPCIDWIWNALTPTERDKYMNGYQTTWVGGVHDGETVTVPGYTTIALVNQSRTWGGLTQPESNYFWGCFRNEIQYALMIYYEDPTTAMNLLTFALATTNSRWSSALAWMNSGTGQKGLFIEGAGYGAVDVQYPLIVFESLKNYGRDLFLETDWFKDALSHLIYSLSPQPTPTTDADASAYRVYNWADAESSNGYPLAASIYHIALAMYLSRYYGEATTGKYARYWQSLVGGTLAKYYQSLDTGGTTLDWRTQSLAKHWRYTGSDWYVRRTGWDGNETQWIIQAIAAPGSHGHDDCGSFQICRKNRWLTKETSGYSITIARYGFITTVAASPSPTTTQFKLDGLPTTLTYWGVNAPIKFMTGALAGTTGQSASVDPATGILTLSSALAQAPAAGDMVSYQMTPTSTRVNGVGYNAVSAHNGITIAMAGFPAANSRLSSAGVVTSFFNEYTGYCSIGYDLTAMYRGSGGTPNNAKPDYTTGVIREYYLLDSLETMVVLDRIACKTFGTTAFMAWTDTAMPTTFHLNTHHAPTLDGANKLLHTWDTQCLRVFTLLPTSPLRYVNSLTDFVGSHTSAGWYQYRTEIQDSGSAQRYFLHVLQARDSTEADITAAITAEDASTWTVTITHATKGNATLTLNKGMAASEGSVLLS